MQRQAVRRLGTLTGALLSALALSAPAGSKPPLDFHDARYCEILVLTGEVPDAKVAVWNTIGLNDCPAGQWEAMDAGALAQELGARAVILNGPRHFLMDSATGHPGPPRTLGGLRMRKVATIPITREEDLLQRTYSERTIKRDNTWTWEAGRRVYELLAPDGSSYVMQSYSQIRDPDLAIGQLRGLGERLDLPQGWRYRSRVLRRDLTLIARGKATIVQDDLTNTYQRVSRRPPGEPVRVNVQGALEGAGAVLGTDPKFRDSP